MGRLAKLFRDYSVATFFLPAAVILIVFGAFIFSTISGQVGFKEITATVSKAELSEPEHVDTNGTHADATYLTYVKYTVDGKEYEEFLGEFNDPTVGRSMEIIYNPKDPSHISTKVNIVFPIGLMTAGAVSLIIGIVSIIRTRKTNIRLKKQEEEWNHDR